MRGVRSCLVVLLSWALVLPTAAPIPVLAADSLGKSPAKGGDGDASVAVLAGLSITSPGPLSSITISPDLNCAVNHVADTVGEFYGDTACATLLAANGVLYGPNFIPAGGSDSPRTAFTPVSQNLTRTGSPGDPCDPCEITTVVDAGASGLRITETDRYVSGDAFYQTNVTVRNTAGSAVNVVLYRAGDCFLQDSDFGFGQTSVDLNTRRVACVAARTLSDGSEVPGGRIEEWQTTSAGSAHFEGFYDDLWAAIGTQQMFPNTNRNGENIDNGAGLSWSFTVPAGGESVHTNRFTITSLGCYQEELVNSVGTSSDQVMVVYDARYLWPENDSNYLDRAQSMAEAIKARAEATLAEYAGLGFPVVDLPRPVNIEVRCDPAFFNLVSAGRPGLTEAADTIKLQADYLRRTMTPLVTGASSAIDATEWANIIDHELVHALQFERLGELPGLWYRYQIEGDYGNIEGTATLGQDLLSGVDDAPVSPGSFLQAVQLFLGGPLPIDTSANSDAAYRVAAFYEYLAERFGDTGLPTLEQRAADMARSLYTGPVHLAGVRDAIGASTTGAVFDTLRDFYVTAYVRRAPNQGGLPLRLRVLDETTAYGQPIGTGPTPPSWGSVQKTVSQDAVSPTQDVQIANPSLDPTKGIVYEVPLAPGLSEVRVTVRDHPNGYVFLKGSPLQDRLRLGFVPVAAGSVAIDPAFFRTGPAPTTSETYDIPVVGMDKLGIAVVAGRQKGDYEITIEARSGTPGLTMDPIADVADADQARGIPLFVVPSLGGVGSRGLPANVFSATVDGVSAAVTAAFDLQGRYLLFVKPAASLAVGSHTVTVRYGTATASRTVEITTSGGGGNAPVTVQNADDALATALVLGGAREAGTPIDISFVLADGGVGFPGATVTATITDPGAIARTVPLGDDGSPLDSGWADGAYGALAYGTDLAGTYTVRVDAAGTDSAGAPFAVSETGTIDLGPKIDGDGDGVADSIEPTFGLSASDPADGAQDPDLDGLSTFAELAAGSDPLNSDTDEGGEADGSELAAGRSPLNATDDATLPPVVVAAVARDGRRIEVSVAARDGATPVRLYRLSDGVLTDLGLRQGAGDTFLDGPLAPGTYEYLGVAEAASGARSGFISSGPVVARDDATPPTARITIAGNRPATNQATIGVQFTDLTEPVIEMRLAETLDELAAAAWVPYQTETTFTLGAGDGLHEVFAQVRDASGLASPVAQAIVELDTAAPTSSVGALPPSTTAASIDIPFTAGDGAGSGVDTVELWVRSRAGPGAPWSAWALAAAASGSPITYAFPDYGEYEFYTTAIDLAGNRESAPSVADASTRRQMADSTPPMSAAGALNSTYTSNTVSVPYTAIDDASGLASIELWARYRANEARPWGPYALAFTGSTSPFTYTFASGDGNYEFYTIAVDNAGNRELAPAVADAATRRDAVEDPPDFTAVLSATGPPLCPDPTCVGVATANGVVLTGSGTAVDDRTSVSVSWRLYGVSSNGSRRQLIKQFQPATPSDGSFNTRLEGFSLSDSRPDQGYAYYDVEIKVVAGNTSTVRTIRVAIERSTNT